MVLAGELLPRWEMFFLFSKTLISGPPARGFVEVRLNIKDEFEKTACDKRGREMGGQVVVEEELTAHEVEWEVVCSPSKEEEPSGIVQARSSPWDSLAGYSERRVYN